LLPFGRGQLVLQDPRVAVERGQLAGFLFERHAREQILDAPVDGLGRVLVRILLSVLVEVDPCTTIAALRARSGRDLGRGVEAENEGKAKGNEPVTNHESAREGEVHFPSTRRQMPRGFSSLNSGGK